MTLQPIRRFDLDAAIIFSDILVVPDALGQKVWFAEGEGPKLEPLTDPAQFGQLSRARLPDHLAPVYDAIRQVRGALPGATALLGFAGAPFTLACYMIEGGSSRDFAAPAAPPTPRAACWRSACRATSAGRSWSRTGPAAARWWAW
ncbi:MAG: uroporphyrinogen decarboxylase family protein [Pseudomonadota bacterium]